MSINDSFTRLIRALKEDSNELESKPVPSNDPVTYELKKWSLFFQSKDAISYQKLGKDKTPQSLYKEGDSFSEKGDNFQWIYIAINFIQKKGKEIKEGTYSRQLNGWAGLEGNPDIFGVPLDPQDVKVFENTIGVFDGSKVSFPLSTKTGSSELLFFEPKGQANMLKFSAELLHGVFNGKSFMSGFMKYDFGTVSKQFNSFSFRLVGPSGKLLDIYRQPVSGFKGTIDNIYDTNKGKEIEDTGPKGPVFEPVDQQNKKLENKRMGCDKDSAQSGGFDILQRLVKKQKENMEIRHSGVEEKESAVGMLPGSTSSNKKQVNTSDPNTVKKLQKYHAEVSKAYGQMSKTMENVQKNLTRIQASDTHIGRVIKKYLER